MVRVNGAPANSVVDLLALELGRGAELRLSATGPQAAEALAALERLIGEGFGEE